MGSRAPVVTQTPGTGTGKAKLSCWSKVSSCRHQGAASWLWLTLQKLSMLSGTSFGNISRNQRLHQGQGDAGSQGHLGLFSPNCTGLGGFREGV